MRLYYLSNFVLSETLFDVSAISARNKNQPISTIFTNNMLYSNMFCIRAICILYRFINKPNSRYTTNAAKYTLTLHCHKHHKHTQKPRTLRTTRRVSTQICAPACRALYERAANTFNWHCAATAAKSRRSLFPLHKRAYVCALCLGVVHGREIGEPHRFLRAG